jgi:hypothetical protein
MDAYLRSVGIEMQTYAVDGHRVAPRARDAFECAVRAALVAYVLRGRAAVWEPESGSTRARERKKNE